MELEPQPASALTRPPADRAVRTPGSRSEVSTAIAPAFDTRRTLAYASASLAAVSLLDAIAALIVREELVRAYNGPDCGTSRSTQCGQYRDAAVGAEVVAGVGFGLAGAFTLASVLLFTRRASPPPSALSISVCVTNCPLPAVLLQLPARPDYVILSCTELRYTACIHL
jgi:hypothetical protein